MHRSLSLLFRVRSFSFLFLIRLFPHFLLPMMTSFMALVRKKGRKMFLDFRFSRKCYTFMHHLLACASFIIHSIADPRRSFGTELKSNHGWQPVCLPPGKQSDETYLLILILWLLQCFLLWSLLLLVMLSDPPCSGLAAAAQLPPMVEWNVPRHPMSKESWDVRSHRQTNKPSGIQVVENLPNKIIK